MHSFPTPPDAAKTEQINDGFLKMHPGPPVHYFTKCTDDHFHTHNWVFTTHIILGGYIEEVLQPNADGTWRVETFRREPGTSHTIELGVAHRLVELIDGPCITRCEYGPPIGKWGVVRLLHDGRAIHRFHDELEWSKYKPVAA